MRSLRLLTPALFLPLLFILSCAPARQDMVVADIGDTDLTLGEYENLFLKTSSSRENPQETTPEERDRFLDLVTNFRLKILDAYSMGMDRKPEVAGEVNLYKGSLATSYLIDKEVSEPGISLMYDQKRTEYRASHILLAFPEEADSADSASAYSLAYDLIGRIKAGEDFSKLAVNASVDPSVTQNRGDLYYFSAGQMVRPFEEAVMKMQVGEVSTHPVRSSFGLHIIKLVDKKPAPGEIRCSHIMARFSGPDPSPEDTSRAYEKIAAIMDSLNQGADFAELARAHSEDPGSSRQGGDLGWFGRRRWVFEFDEAAFKLAPGQQSGIVRSRYGYHIISCTEARAPKTFDEAREEIKSLYEQARFEGDRAAFMAGLKAETGFSRDETVLARLLGEVDTLRTMRDPLWADSISQDLRSSVLIRFTGSAVTVDSVISMLKARPDLNSTSLRSGPFKSAIDQVTEQAIFLKKSESLEREDPEFAGMMKEYKDGIVLYQIEQEKVWNRITVEEADLRSYFEANRDRFAFPDRIEYKELRCAGRDIAEEFREEVQRGTTFEQIVYADSVRMTRENNQKLPFAKNSTRFMRESLETIRSVADDLNSDSRLRLHIVGHPDTSNGNERNSKLASDRVKRISDWLTSKHGISASRIQTFVRPIRPQIRETADREILNTNIDLDIIGRRKGIIAPIETSLVPIDHDELSTAANELGVGDVSAPVRYRNGFSLVRLLGRDSARLKTFDEAGTEVSSAYQESESKRLEQEWLDELRVRYPVVEHKEVLNNAFVVQE